MAFQPGKPKTGGRKAGVQNKKTIIKSTIDEFFKLHNFDPLFHLLDLVQKDRIRNPDGLIDGLSDMEKAEICMELLEYIYSKPKALDVNLQATAALVDSDEMHPYVQEALSVIGKDPLPPA